MKYLQVDIEARAEELEPVDRPWADGVSCGADPDWLLLDAL